MSSCDRPRPGLPRVSPRPHTEALGTRLVSELTKKANFWLEQPIIQTTQPEKQVQPEDSVSSVGSHRSSRARSKTSSLRSSSSAKAKAVAEQAALEAKASTLQKLHELQFEELKIQQRKSEVELQAEIAAAEAKRKIYKQTEMEETCGYHSHQYVIDENKSLPIPPQSTIHHLTTWIMTKQSSSKNSISSRGKTLLVSHQ